MTNVTTDVMKLVFSEYGVPKTVISDRGPQFSSKELKAFASLYCFDHIKSSPQGNGFIKQMIQRVRQCLRKCMSAEHDPYLAILIYRTTPLSSSLPAPSELLNGKRYRALQPTKSRCRCPQTYYERSDG